MIATGICPSSLPMQKKGGWKTITASKPSEIRISPDGRIQLAKIRTMIFYEVVIPRYGNNAYYFIAKPESAAFLL